VGTDNPGRSTIAAIADHMRSTTIMEVHIPGQYIQGESVMWLVLLSEALAVMLAAD
jgi:hypothetical protein